MRILVTGGAGFLGSYLCKRLVDDGHEVICYDTLLTGDARNVESLPADRFTLVDKDVTKSFGCDGPLDWVMHLACPASPKEYLRHPIHTLELGAQGTHHCLDLATEKGAAFFLASTSEVYGDPHVHPQTETYWGNVNPVGPRSVYDEAKRYAEALTFAFHRTNGVPVRVGRIFNTYGPRMRRADGRAVPNFVDQGLRGQPMTVYGDGGQTRSLCFVSDLIEGLVRLMDHEGEAMPVNLGNPREVTVLELAKMIGELIGSPYEISFEEMPVDDPRQRCPDITRARELLKWEPTIEMEEGLVTTVEWCRKNW